MTTPHSTVVCDAVALVLAGLVTAVAGRVYRARTWPTQEDEQPALLVYGWQEELKRTGGDSTQSQYEVAYTLAVVIRVNAASADGEAAEADLQEIAGTVREAVLTCASLFLAPGRLIESIEGVKTTLGIDTRTGEVAVGQAQVAFSMKWTEVFAVPSPPVDCTGFDTFVRLKAVPASP